VPLAAPRAAGPAAAAAALGPPPSSVLPGGEGGGGRRVETAYELSPPFCLKHEGRRRASSPCLVGACEKQQPLERHSEAGMPFQPVFLLGGCVGG
jgi:hypothetical protein